MVGGGRAVGGLERAGGLDLLYGDVLLGEVDGAVMYGEAEGRDLGE